jgi:hypothetical protein
MCGAANSDDGFMSQRTQKFFQISNFHSPANGVSSLPFTVKYTPQRLPQPEPFGE